MDLQEKWCYFQARLSNYMLSFFWYGFKAQIGLAVISESKYDVICQAQEKIIEHCGAKYFASIKAI